jgi:hypothetical protein
MLTSEADAPLPLPTVDEQAQRAPRGGGEAKAVCDVDDDRVLHVARKERVVERGAELGVRAVRRGGAFELADERVEGAGLLAELEEGAGVAGGDSEAHDWAAPLLREDDERFWRNDSAMRLRRGSSVKTAPPSPMVMWCAG